MDKLKLLSLNVRGIKDTAKRCKLFHWLHKKQVDIILLQETHGTDSDEKQWPHEWGDKHFYMNHGTNQSAGVSTLFRQIMPLLQEYYTLTIVEELLLWPLFTRIRNM